MQVIGFNLTKIHAERSSDFKRGPINTNIEFTEITEEEMGILKDANVLKVDFLFEVAYTESEKDKDKQAEVTYEGNIALSTSKEESEEILKSWKDKQIPDNTRMPLINFILKKCSTKALMLEDELNIPPHIPMPRVRKEEKH